MSPVQDPQVVDSLEALWRTYYPRIVVYICSSFPTLRGEAGDLAQETFLHAHAAIDPRSGDDASRAWLYVIARNLCIDRIRRLRKESSLGCGPEGIDSKEDPDAGAFEHLERKRVRNTVAKAVETLDPRDREICYLYYFEEFPVTEIGRVLKCPAGTVKYRLYRIRVLLKRRLEAIHEG